MNSLEHYNYFYENDKNPSIAESLKDFFQTVVSPRLKSRDLKVLDLGAGSKSLFEEMDLEKKNVVAIDFSDIAIAKARKSSQDIRYEAVDLSAENALLNNQFDLIFDSHCLHCIEGIIERKTALDNIYRALEKDGIFCAEMMIQSGKSQVSLPFKHIPVAIDLERELVEAGFVITYFLISRNLKFYNDNGECDLLRVVCRK